MIFALGLQKHAVSMLSAHPLNLQYLLSDYSVLRDFLGLWETVENKTGKVSAFIEVTF